MLRKGPLIFALTSACVAPRVAFPSGLGTRVALTFLFPLVAGRLERDCAVTSAARLVVVFLAILSPFGQGRFSCAAWRY